MSDILAGKKFGAVAGDCQAWFATLPEQCFDLVFGSPPYCDARTYGVEAQRDCAEWVGWMLDVTEAAIRVSKGMVLWVVAGVTREKNYWPACEGLAWEWWKRGHQQWRPCVWWKVDENNGGTGIPGSGGKQWLRADWEYVLAFKREGWLPWADNTAMGHPPIYDRVGGAMSNRTVEGQRMNDAIGTRLARPKPMPKFANPGNILPDLDDGLVVKARVGGGHIGSPLAHEGEAPFPEKLAEFFVRSFCPPGGIVCDPFSGSGTTAAVAVRHGRRAMCCDLRQSQVDLTNRRVQEELRMVGQTASTAGPPRTTAQTDKPSLFDGVGDLT